MLSLSLGLMLSGVMLQGLMAESQNGTRFAGLVRERAAQRRTLELIKLDLAQATIVSAAPELEQHACSLSGRKPVLHLKTAAGPITYSVGLAPSTIWRGSVLMRCGPAFGLDGAMSVGSQMLNRVVLDGLAVEPHVWTGCAASFADLKNNAVVDLAGSSHQSFSACLDPHSGLIAIRLEQEFFGSNGARPQRLALVRVLGSGR